MRRSKLDAVYGERWDVHEAEKVFHITKHEPTCNFSHARRKDDKVDGTLKWEPLRRFYFDFKEMK